MLVYTTQSTTELFDNVLLTSGYADNRTVMDVSGMTKLTLDLAYTRGAAEASSDLFFTIEHSPDNGATWHSLTIDETSTVSKLTAREWTVESAANLSVIIDIAYKLIRVSVREASVSANYGRVTMFATASGL